MPISPVVLVPGGLYEDMDTARFWVKPGVAAGLRGAGFDVVALDRLRRPTTWAEDASALADRIRSLGGVAVAVVAGSNGCSTAVRLALDHRDLVAGLVLCWPATANDELVDRRVREAIEAEAGAEVADSLLRGHTLRGATDDELRRLDLPVTVVPSQPENPVHQHTTVEALGRLFPNVRIAAGSPESPRPEFAVARLGFLRTLSEALAAD
jgi:pimeloyl-ACP methyl ester carboxylesterase